MAMEKHAKALRVKIRRMIIEGGPRLGQVKAAQLSVRPKATQATVMLLDLVSPTLESLEISAPPIPNFFTAPSVEFDSLDYQFLIADLHFPSLTHVHIHRDSLHFSEFLPSFAVSRLTWSTFMPI
jgi:hypothetical protein